MIIIIIFRLLLTEWPSARIEAKVGKKCAQHTTHTTIQLNYTFMCWYFAMMMVLPLDQTRYCNSLFVFFITSSRHYTHIVSANQWAHETREKNKRSEKKKTSRWPLGHDCARETCVFSFSINSMLLKRIICLFTWTRVFSRCAFGISIFCLFSYARRVYWLCIFLFDAEETKQSENRFSRRSFCARE